MNLLKKLIINADDYGISPEVNAATEQLALAGRLGGASVLVNGSCCHAALDFLRCNPQVGAGIHLNAIEGQPLSSSQKIFPILNEQGTFVGIAVLLKRWLLHPQAITVAVEIEWRAQIEFLLQAGIRITNADSHQHLHAFPLAYRLAVRLCHEFEIPALRIPLERHSRPGRTMAALALRASLFGARLLQTRTGLKSNDHFLGFRRAGAYDSESLINDLTLLPPGVTELALHPSTKDSIPYPNLRGDAERRAILHDEFPAHLKRLGIELINWGDL